jgi:hypothetical protein
VGCALSRKQSNQRAYILQHTPQLKEFFFEHMHSDFTMHTTRPMTIHVHQHDNATVSACQGLTRKNQK